ncbi:MAG: bifunctional DNA primase/polymerase, partial [Candidatus Parvarchaeota archaeon]
MVTIEQAMEYLNQGFSVIPLQARDKKPLIDWAEYQKRKPTEEEIRQWFKDEKNNIGIICGEVSGNLVVFDFDDQEYMPFVIEDIDEVAKKTLVVRTGKGFHVYYRIPNVSSRKLMNLKIDIKAEGGYVVAPPSIHPSGVRYETVGKGKVSDAPSELINLLIEADETFPIAKAIAQVWGTELDHRHELSLGLASFFRLRAKWPKEKTENLIRGVMRLKHDREEIKDRMRAIDDAYKKDYPYNNHLRKELVEQLISLLPVGTGEIWRYYDKGDRDSDYSRSYMCNNEGVFRITHQIRKDQKGSKTPTDESEIIFRQPLILTDAWHAEGDEENRIKFTFFLGKMK